MSDRENCLFLWLEARNERGPRGRHLPLIPLPPRPFNLRAYVSSDHIGLEGKRLQLQPHSPLGDGVARRNIQATLSLDLGWSHCTNPAAQSNRCVCHVGDVYLKTGPDRGCI